MNLSSWTQVVRQADVRLNALPCIAAWPAVRQTDFRIKMNKEGRCTCLDWSTSSRLPTLLAIGWVGGGFRTPDPSLQLMASVWWPYAARPATLRKASSSSSSTGASECAPAIGPPFPHLPAWPLPLLIHGRLCPVLNQAAHASGRGGPGRDRPRLCSCAWPVSFGGERGRWPVSAHRAHEVARVRTVLSCGCSRARLMARWSSSRLRRRGEWVLLCLSWPLPGAGCHAVRVGPAWRGLRTTARLLSP
jgi:hypothetical protein